VRQILPAIIKKTSIFPQIKADICKKFNFLQFFYKLLGLFADFIKHKLCHYSFISKAD